MRRQLLDAVMSFGLLLSVGALTANFWLIPFTPVHFAYPEQPMPILSPTVKPGETVVVKVTRCNHQDAPIRLEATRRLVGDGGTIIILPSVQFDMPPGCETVTSRLTPIPGDAPPGRYVMTGTFSGANRWGRVVVFGWSTEAFEVVG